MKVAQHIFRICLISLFGLGVACRPVSKDQPAPDRIVQDCNERVEEDSLSYPMPHGALLATHFRSLEELKKVVRITYFNEKNDLSSAIRRISRVQISHCSEGKKVVSILEAGISQTDITKAARGSIFQQISLTWGSPFAVSNRNDLERVYLMSRWKPDWFGEGDVAFYNLAESMVKHINTPDLAFQYVRDTSEKGYINTFNHITAQAFITSFFSEEMADFVADVHERYNMPELITGEFTPEQLAEPDDNPVDNYVDMVNNEWGQELGKQLAQKYGIHHDTRWTAESLCAYLNDIQGYFAWAFQIGFEPFRPEEEVVQKFYRKFNQLMDRYLAD